MKALFLSKYSRLGGSSRYMVYDYLDFFHDAGIQAEVVPLFDERYHQGLGNLATYTGLGNILKHRTYYAQRVLERLRWVRQTGQYDIVVLEKELIPYFPYGLENFLGSRQARLVTLFDDATHAYYARHPNRIVRLLCHKKIERIVRLSDHIIVWNAYLGEWARQFSPNVTVVNTGVDLRRYRVKTVEDTACDDQVVIGWIGTPNSYGYIRELETVFKELASRYRVQLRVVSSQDYTSPNIHVDNRRWSIGTEVDDLCSFDIGIMPLPNDEWTRGKSGCKAVQYLAVGVPAVCSPVGITTEIICDGENGFLASTPAEWIDKLARLIEDADLRRKQGEMGRKLVVNTYSIQAVAPRLIETLQSVAKRPVNDHNRK